MNLFPTLVLLVAGLQGQLGAQDSNGTSRPVVYPPEHGFFGRQRIHRVHLPNNETDRIVLIHESRKTPSLYSLFDSELKWRGGYKLPSPAGANSSSTELVTRSGTNVSVQDIVRGGGGEVLDGWSSVAPSLRELRDHLGGGSVGSSSRPRFYWVFGPSGDEGKEPRFRNLFNGNASDDELNSIKDELEAVQQSYNGDLAWRIRDGLLTMPASLPGLVPGIDDKGIKIPLGSDTLVRDGQLRSGLGELFDDSYLLVSSAGSVNIIYSEVGAASSRSYYHLAYDFPSKGLPQPHVFSVDRVDKNFWLIASLDELWWLKSSGMPPTRTSEIHRVEWTQASGEGGLELSGERIRSLRIVPRTNEGGVRVLLGTSSDIRDEGGQSRDLRVRVLDFDKLGASRPSRTSTVTLGLGVTPVTECKFDSPKVELLPVKGGHRVLAWTRTRLYSTLLAPGGEPSVELPDRNKTVGIGDSDERTSSDAWVSPVRDLVGDYWVVRTHGQPLYPGQAFPHRGVDFAAGTDAHIVSPIAGTVVVVAPESKPAIDSKGRVSADVDPFDKSGKFDREPLRRYQSMIVLKPKESIDGDPDLYIQLLHLNPDSISVAPGEGVEPGQYLGQLEPYSEPEHAFFSGDPPSIQSPGYHKKAQRSYEPHLHVNILRIEDLQVHHSSKRPTHADCVKNPLDFIAHPKDVVPPELGLVDVSVEGRSSIPLKLGRVVDLPAGSRGREANLSLRFGDRRRIDGPYTTPRTISLRVERFESQRVSETRTITFDGSLEARAEGRDLLVEVADDPAAGHVYLPFRTAWNSIPSDGSVEDATTGTSDCALKDLQDGTYLVTIEIDDGSTGRQRWLYCFSVNG